MKILSFLAGELPNSATHFTTFANVNQSEAYYYKKTFGISRKQFGKAKRKLMEKEECLESTKHKKLLAYIVKELRSRQFHFPLIEHYIDVTKTVQLRNV